MIALYYRMLQVICPIARPSIVKVVTCLERPLIVNV
jgi:hypothetical protein